MPCTALREAVTQDQILNTLSLEKGVWDHGRGGAFARPPGTHAAVAAHSE